MKQQYDVIVVGCGHAGIEAAQICARQGLGVLIATVRWDRTGQMSCNPSIGGLAKGHIVKEMDILGGWMGRAADESCLQFKRLNTKKGPAVRGSRMQCDKEKYSLYMRRHLSALPRISFISTEVKALILKNQTCQGVVTEKGDRIFSKAVILTTGTFMKGWMHIGRTKTPGGRVGEKATQGLSDQLKGEGLKVFRLKTGTPARVHKKSVNFSKLKSQKGDEGFRPFSFFTSFQTPPLPQQPCYITYTNENTHEVIRKNLRHSPLYTGAIQSVGPRYCPSIEDKVTRFADKTRHQSFLEPETLTGESIYLQGLSTSLPAPVQEAFLKTIAGLENVKILRPGYAVEYDFFDPLQIFPSLETKAFKNLFFAGQINGSSGYEEAAGQGLLAGINASCKIKGFEPVILKRHEAYIGVLIDDLVTRGTKEPYRMLTSRAEHRLLLREDNAVERLFFISKKGNWLSTKELSVLDREIQNRQKLSAFLSRVRISPFWAGENKTSKPPPPFKSFKRVLSGKQLLSRPEMDYSKLKLFLNTELKSLSASNIPPGGLKEFCRQGTFKAQTWEAVEVGFKYEGYIRREKQFIAACQKMDTTSLEAVSYDQVQGLSLEALEKLKEVRPRTLAQAGRISGVSPAALQALIIYLKMHKKNRKNIKLR